MRRIRLVSPVAVLILLFLVPAPEARARTTEWPQFRGPDVLGAAEADGALEKASGLRIAWKEALGSGYSGVSVARGRVITMFSEGASDLMAAFDEASGKRLWTYEMGPVSKGFDGSHDGPLSTPLIAGEHVVGLTNSGRLFAVHFETGRPVWAVDLAKKFDAAKPYYGFGSSPVLADGVIVLQIGAGGNTIAGFDVASGERLWSAGSATASYQTPVVIREGGRAVVVAGDIKNLYGIEPATGNVLWEFEHGGGGTGYGAGKITPVPAGDGRFFLVHKDDGAKMVSVTRKDELTVPETLWENRSMRHSYATPVYHEGHIYGYSSRFLICLDAATGEARWRSRDPGDGFLALVDGHLVLVTKDGSVHVAEASPEGYREVAGLDVFEDHAWAAPSFANGHILVRSLGELARVAVAGRPTRASIPAPVEPGLERTAFGRFLGRLGRAEDKASAVDAYLEGVETFPIVEHGWVHFIYRGDADDVVVGGDLMEVGRERRMRRVEGTDLFHYSTPLEPDARINYLFVVDYESTLDPLNPRKTTMTFMTEDFELAFGGQEMEMSWFAMPAWRAPDYLEEAAPDRRGRLVSHELESKIAGGKAPLQVYLPAGYDKGEQRYPVVYVHSGPDALERGQWTVALDNLIGERIEPVLAVFIGPVPAQGPQYTRVVAEEIVPHIDANYRTVASVSGRANYGSGFGGVSAFFATFTHPELFGKLATQSAFLWEFAWVPLQSMIQPAGESAPRIYLEWGKYDLRNSHENWDVNRLNRQMVAFLEKQGYEPGGGEVADGSGWPSWRTRTDDILTALYPKRRAAR